MLVAEFVRPSLSSATLAPAKGAKTKRQASVRERRGWVGVSKTGVDFPTAAQAPLPELLPKCPTGMTRAPRGPEVETCYHNRAIR